MKMFYLSLFLLFSSGFLRAQVKSVNLLNTNDSLLTDYIISCDYSKFIGKSIGDFLNDKTFKAFKKKRYYEPKMGILKGIGLIYTNDVQIIPIIKNFEVVKSYSKERRWVFNDILKERIYEFRIVYLNDEFWVSPDVDLMSTKKNRKILLKILRRKEKSDGKTVRYDTI